MKTLSQIKNIEKSLQLTLFDEEAEEWWDDADPELASTVDSFGNIIIDLVPSLATGPMATLGDYLEYDPPISGVYLYDNDMDWLPFPCGRPATDNGAGVNILYYDGLGVDNDLFDYLDGVIDDGDGSTCGRVRLNDDPAIVINLAKQPDHTGF